ncbi:hypothetical protein ABTX81_06470 [Kitasatospora sp. NPDC097605]|uniref:TolB family protein n=1 Tax=Kitasatospora sp. NPDC097605 TaxID=3157226 RepID=UPI00332FA20F
MAADGTQGNAGSNNAVISRDGRYVAFTSWSTNLVPADPPLPRLQVRGYLRDLRDGTVERVTVDGVMAGVRDFSASGERVVLKAGDALYVRDLPTGLTQRVDVDLGDFTGGYPDEPRISGSGRYVVFSESSPSNAPVNGGTRIYVRDLLEGTTQWVSPPSTGPEKYDAHGPVISDDGQRIAYTYLRRVPPAYGHVPGDTNGVWDVFARTLPAVP